MNWLLVITLGFCGLLMGWLSVNGYTHKIEPFLWLMFAAIAAILIATNVKEQIFVHGFCIGILWGIMNGLTQALFFKKYLTNNPAFKHNFEKVTFMPARLFPLLTGPLIGLVAGVVLGLFCLAAKKLT